MQDTFLKRHLILTILFGAGLLILGIFLMFRQQSFLCLFVSILGLFVAGSGFYSLFTLKQYQLGRRSRTVTLVKALLSIVLGLVALIAPLTAANFSWTFLLYLIAAELVFSAVISFMDVLLLRSSGVVLTSLLSDAIFSLVVAVLLFVFPQQIGTMLLKLFGVAMIATGSGMLIWAWRIRMINKRAGSQTIEAEAIVVDEPSDKD